MLEKQLFQKCLNKIEIFIMMLILQLLPEKLQLVIKKTWMTYCNKEFLNRMKHLDQIKIMNKLKKFKLKKKKNPKKKKLLQLQEKIQILLELMEMKLQQICLQIPLMEVLKKIQFHKDHYQYRNLKDRMKVIRIQVTRILIQIAIEKKIMQFLFKKYIIF